jgi:hypothetical protein
MKKIAITIILISSLVTAPVSHAADTKNPYGTSTVDPAGPNEVIFTVSKGSKVASFTSIRISKMKTTTITIYEPFLKKRQTFSVIPMKTFFAFVGISGKDKVVTSALNDYQYTNTAEGFISAGAYIAVKRSGAPISYDQGGPLRIIFGDKSKWAKQLDSWNWSLASISVK